MAARILIAPLGLVAVATWTAPARAECPQPYTPMQLATDLVTARTALSNLETDAFSEAGKRLEAGIVCLSGSANPQVFANAYRYIGSYHFLVLHDEAGARRWFRTAQELVPTMTFGAEELELDHPMRAVYDDENQHAGDEPALIADKVVFLPAGSKLYIDGRLLEKPGATLDRPHIVQQVGTDGSARGTWLIDGNAIPPQLLQDKVVTAAPPPPKPKATKKNATAVASNPDGTPMVIEVKGERDPLKVPALVTGALFVVGAGGLFAASFAAHDQFERVDTTDELEQTRTLTNALVLSSGGVLAVGLGVSYWGITLDDGVGVRLAGSF
jgi:hypothetical protein